jgi:hypothetical protein
VAQAREYTFIETRMAYGYYMKNIIFCMFAIFSCPSLFAYSGAGAECGNKDIERVAMLGAPVDLELAITKEISRIELLIAQRKFIVKYPRWVNGKTILEKRSIYIRDWQGCYATILDFPAAVGNLDNIKYLLSHGADPTGIDSYGKSIFMRCRSLSPDGMSLSDGMPGKHISEALERGKIMAYKMLIENGGNIDYVAKESGVYGKSALDTCRDFSLIKLYLDLGSDPNSDIYRKVNYGEKESNVLIRPSLIKLFDSSDWEVDNDLRIFEFLYPKIKNKFMTKSDRWRVCYDCVRDSKARKSRKQVCDRLSKILDPGIKLIYSNVGGQESDDEVCDREFK